MIIRVLLLAHLACFQFSGPVAEAAESAPASGIELTLQRRGPKTGEIELTKEKVDPAHVGIVVVDMWNFHWCKTSTQRVGALVPRMAAVLRAAHQMCMTIFWCPSDVADNYAGTTNIRRR